MSDFIKDGRYPLTVPQIQEELSHHNVSTTAGFNPEVYGYIMVYDTQKPEYNPDTQTCKEIFPVELPHGNYTRWFQQWEVSDISQETITHNHEAHDAQLAKQKSDNIQALWAAANAYTENYISGVAIGLLTIGVIQQKPKAMAVVQWSGAVWREYYIRKSQVTATQPANLDFSMFGPMPFSVPELQVEVGM